MGEMICEMIPEKAQRKDERHYGFKLNESGRLDLRLYRLRKTWYVIKKIGGKWFKIYAADSHNDAIDFYCSLAGIEIFPSEYRLD